VGGWHPLLSIPRATPGSARLERAWFAVSGGTRARRRARELTRVVGGRSFSLAEGPEARRRYHAVATLIAGGGASLFDAALSALDGAVERPLAERAFARLAKSVLDNVARVGPAAALTGPAVRGDLDVVAGHLEVLGVGGDEAGSAVQLYRALLLRTAAMLEQDGRLDGEKLGALRALAAAAD